MSTRQRKAAAPREPRPRRSERAPTTERACWSDAAPAVAARRGRRRRHPRRRPRPRDIYQWLPFTQSDLTTAAKTTLAFANVYANTSYTETKAAYAGKLTGLTTAPEAATLVYDFETPEIAATRTADKQVATGTPTIELDQLVRPQAPGPPVRRRSRSRSPSRRNSSRPRARLPAHRSTPSRPSRRHRLAGPEHPTSLARQLVNRRAAGPTIIGIALALLLCLLVVPMLVVGRHRHAVRRRSTDRACGSTAAREPFSRPPAPSPRTRSRLTTCTGSSSWGSSTTCRGRSWPASGR